MTTSSPSIWAISDLHLSFGVDKPMKVFGVNWENYIERLTDNWRAKVKADDYVILNGDTSWATYLENTVTDFEFIESLPGKKIITKGNHDYWWTTLNKLTDFLDEHHFSSITFLHNSAILCGEIAIAGTRGWQNTSSQADDTKMFNRELIRLEISLQQASALSPKAIVAALHYPPSQRFMEKLSAYNVIDCIYGHLHANWHKLAMPPETNGIRYSLVSSDYLAFDPLLIYPR